MELGSFLNQHLCSSWLNLGLLLFAIVLWWCFRSNFKSARLPPGPFNLPVLGCLPLLGALPHVSLHRLSKKYGDIMHLKLGTVPYVIISSSRVAKEMYRSHGLEFASKAPLISGRYFGYNYHGFAFSEYTPEVKLYRKIVNTHLLSASRLKIYDSIRREEQCGLAQSVLKEQGRPIVLRERFHELNMNTITYMLFGERFYGIQARNTPKLDEFMAALIEGLRLAGMLNISDFIPGTRWLDLQGLENRFKQVFAVIDEQLRTILQERKKKIPRKFSSNDEPVPFIDVLISLDHSTEEQVPDSAKLGILCELLLGAVDTSAVTLEWAMAELIRHPSKLEKAQQQIDSVVGKNNLVRDSDLSKLPYVEAIAKETLRLHPPAPLALPKVVRGGPARLLGYSIPDGTCAFINFYSIGIDGDSWVNPLDFVPERFLEEEEEEENIDVFGQDCRLLPFGGGRRVCPGARLGFDTLQIGIATMVQGFDWILPDEQKPDDLDMREVYGLVCNKAVPLVAVARARLEEQAYRDSRCL